VWAALAVWLAATGQLLDFWRASVVWTFAGGYPANPEGRAAALIAFFRYRFCWFAVPAAGALLAFRVARPADQALRGLLGLWLLFALAAFAAPGWMTDNQTPPFFPALAALSGIGLAGVQAQFRSWRAPARTLGLALLVLLAATPLADRYQIRLRQSWSARHAPERPVDQRLGAWLDARLPPGERLYVVGVWVPVYIHAHRLAPTPYFYTGLGTTPRVRAQVLGALREHPPGAVVFTYMIQRRYMQEFAAQVRAWVERGPYRRVELELPGVDGVYLRRDLAAGGRPGEGGAAP
jgi:hypothetical protein